MGGDWGIGVPTAPPAPRTAADPPCPPLPRCRHREWAGGEPAAPPLDLGHRSPPPPSPRVRCGAGGGRGGTLAARRITSTRAGVGADPAWGWPASPRRPAGGRAAGRAASPSPFPACHLPRSQSGTRFAREAPLVSACAYSHLSPRLPDPPQTSGTVGLASDTRGCVCSTVSGGSCRAAKGTRWLAGRERESLRPGAGSGCPPTDAHAGRS